MIGPFAALLRSSFSMARQMLGLPRQRGWAGTSRQDPRPTPQRPEGHSRSRAPNEKMKETLQSGPVTNTTMEAANPSWTASCVHAQAAVATTFETVQRRLTQDRLRSIEDLHHAAQVRWASEEASSLAWMTGYPLLFFPSLFEEKSAAALDRARRQDEIHARSRELLGMTICQTR